MPLPTYNLNLVVSGEWETWKNLPWQSQITQWQLWGAPASAWDTATWDVALWDAVETIYSSLTSYWRSSQGLRTFRGLDIIQPTIPSRAGDAHLVVDNVDGVYSPSTEFLAKSQPLAITVDYNSVNYPFWYGRVDYPVRHPERGNQSVDVPCLGVLATIIGSSESISTALYQNITTDVAIGYILDAIGWPTSQRSFDVGKTTLLWWWCQDENPWTAIQKIMAAEGPTAAIYEDARGNIVFKNRHAIMTLTRCKTSQATFSDRAGAAIQIARPFNYDDGQKHVVNTARWPVNVRTAKALSTVWTGPASITLAANEVSILHPNTTTGDPLTGAVVPSVGGGDYTLVSGSITLALNRTSGQSVMLTLTAGAAGASITGLRLRAQAVTVDSITDITNSVGSPLASGVLNVPLSVVKTPEISSAIAQGLCDSYVALWSSGRPTATVTLENINATVIVQQLTRELLDRVTLVEDMLGINEDYFIVSIAQQVSAGNGRLTTTFDLMKSGTLYGLWDTSLWDTGRWGF